MPSSTHLPAASSSVCNVIDCRLGVRRSTKLCMTRARPSLTFLQSLNGGCWDGDPAGRRHCAGVKTQPGTLSPACLQVPKDNSLCEH